MLPPPVARAQAGTAADLIAAVNAYRASNGLAAYGVDSSLMSKAQSHSEYQASIQTCTHLRADGSGPGDHGISSENIACGMNLSVEGAIYVQWQDALHLATMLGPETGLVGAGVAMSGDTVYYTLDVKRLTGDFTYRPPKQATAETLLPGQSSSTPNPQMVVSGPLVTSTPQEDGSVQHTILYGQTLIQIAEAYGVTLNDLYAANKSLDPTKPVYYDGQTIVIRLPFTATPEPSATLTARPATRTPRPTRTATRVMTKTATSPVTPTPLATETEADGPVIDRRILAFGVILASAIGLVFVVSRGFVKKT